MSKTQQITDDMVEVVGNTYAVREQLKTLGAKWDAADKCWMIAPEKEAEALQLVQAAEAIAPKPVSKKSSTASHFGRNETRGCGFRRADGNWVPGEED